MSPQATFDFDAAEKQHSGRTEQFVTQPEPEREAHGPHLFSDQMEFRKRMREGEMTAAELRATFARMVVSKDAFIADLLATRDAKRLKVLAANLGCIDAARNTKAKNAKAVFERLLFDFSPENSVVLEVFGKETLESAIAKHVEKVTDEALQAMFAGFREQAAARKKALENPETLEEFRTFSAKNGEDALSDEQLARMDALEAELTRQQRVERQPSTVTQIESDGAAELQFSIKEGFHTKRQCPLWIVQLSTRVDKATFAELKQKAKMLGGWYSSFKKDDAGFQFTTPDSAEKFAGLLGGDADRTDELEARKAHKEETAAERLSRLADDLEESAEQALAADGDKLKNTARRADMAAGMRARAFADFTLAQTINCIALALERGTAGFLDGIRHKTHVALLQLTLKRAMWAHRRKASQVGWHEDDRAPDATDVRFAVYPYPAVYKRHLEEAIARVENRKGCKQAARQMRRRIQRADEYVVFEQEYDIGELTSFIFRIRGHVDAAWLDSALEDYKRLRAAGIHDVHELRSALREFLEHTAAPRGDDPVTKAEDELRGKQLPGFFPTPGPLIEQMLELANISDGDRCLSRAAAKEISSMRSLRGIPAAKCWVLSTTAVCKRFSRPKDMTSLSRTSSSFMTPPSMRS